MVRQGVQRTGGVGRRHAARLAAVQALYQMELAGEAAPLVIEEFVAHRLDREIEGVSIGPADQEMFAGIVRGASARREEIDAAISASLDKEREIGRLEAVIRACLRAAGHEMLERIDVPAKVIINEYVDVAKTFFTGNEPRFANGVLDRMAKQLRPAEMATGSGDDAPPPVR
ncbi:MAG: transcription antitermination factor NusB [Alphaproteobacteria bacterium]|nr:transcription antitermination factor NusB [Alphaproteobacteria bacterium]